MKLGRLSFSRVLVLSAFIAFQAVQSLHNHRTVAAEDNCAVCQVVHHTPSTRAPSISAVRLVFTYQALLVVAPLVAVRPASVDTVRSRAPPAC